MSDHLASVERQRGRAVARPEEPEFPWGLEYLYGWFLELLPRRSHGGMSANPLTYTEVKSWAVMTQTPVLPWECRALMRLDDTLMVVLRPKLPKGKPHDRPR